MENKKRYKGFTIIELLVVVSIIAVLAAIVLVNVASYINKGKDAAIRGNLSTILTNAAVYFDANGNYNTFCTNAYVTNPQNAASAAYGTGFTFNCTCDTAGCVATATKFCAQATLKNTNTFCVDSTGAKVEKAAGLLGSCGSGACT